MRGFCLVKAFQNPLSPEEEKYYLERLKSGDNSAKDLLIERNMRLVAHLVKKYNYADRDVEDLISIGTIGLIKAVNTFNGDKGSRLVTYAAKCIDNELLMMLRSEKKRARDTSIYEPLGTDSEGNSISLMDVLESDELDIIEEMELDANIKKLNGLIKDVLTERERQIICLRYGLGDGHEVTQREIAERFGISRSYVSRLEKKALKKLREAYEV
ncbi:MAG: RNA polymerase sporulation sigma factor SigK [Lachnospiraceae bacterium]|nr:RNA polymerase sporulation sigma factor SigK [Lachnospiraceae bacterium]